MIEYFQNPKRLWLICGLSMGLAFAINCAPFFFIGQLAAQSVSISVLELLFCYGMILIGTTLSILSLFSFIMNPIFWLLAKSSSCLIMALVGYLSIARKFHLLNPGLYFTLFGILTTLYGMCMVAGIIQNLKIKLNLKLLTTGISSSLLFLATLVGLFTYQWLMLSEQARILGNVRDISISLGIVAPLMLVAFVKGHQLDPTSPWRSLVMRLPNNRQEIPQRNGLILATVLSFGMIGLRILFGEFFWGPDNVNFLTIFFDFHVGFLAFGFDAFQDLKKSSQNLHKHLFASRLLNQSAKKFLSRHDNNESNWAATVGFKSSTYMIDHDPQEILLKNLPNSVRQLRGEEIHRCLTQMLGGMNLHLLEIGHTIHGAVDAEISVRPCVDLLRLFSCLYLDAGPLVERRINGLAALIPIIDPKLARLLLPRELNSLLKRNYWFFYIDFGWIDQRVTKAHNIARYDVNLANYATGQLIAALRKSDKLQQYGNSIWISPDARTRIIQEAPSLASIIEPNPVAFDVNSTEELFFLIKFEQLIPRLQRYFDLDSLRQIILDFEPSPESAQFLNLFTLQILGSKTVDEIYNILRTILSVPWKGFKEKDGAIKLIISAQEKITSLLGLSGFLADHQTPDAERALEQIHAAVLKIGYPSQTLHRAQVAKNTLRDLTNLIKVAQSPSHPRFSEAWLLLASHDYLKIEPEKVLELMQFLRSIGSNPHLAQLPLPQTKAVEAICSLTRSQKNAPNQNAFLRDLEKIFELYLKWFADARVSPETMCLLLDSHQFLQTQLGVVFGFKPALSTDLDRYVKTIEVDLGANSPKYIALLSRRDSFKLPEVA